MDLKREKKIDSLDLALEFGILLYIHMDLDSNGIGHFRRNTYTIAYRSTFYADPLSYITYIRHETKEREKERGIKKPFHMRYLIQLLVLQKEKKIDSSVSNSFENEM